MIALAARAVLGFVEGLLAQLGHAAHEHCDFGHELGRTQVRRIRVQVPAYVLQFRLRH
jgi:hypothetical protein